MNTIQEYQYKSKKELPLNVTVQALDLRLYYLGPRKRKVVNKSFSGLTYEEALNEASLYVEENGGKFVKNDLSQHRFGIWAACEVERSEFNGNVFFWKKALILRQGFSVSEEQFKQAHGLTINSKGE